MGKSQLIYVFRAVDAKWKVLTVTRAIPTGQSPRTTANRRQKRRHHSMFELSKLSRIMCMYVRVKFLYSLFVV